MDRLHEVEVFVAVAEAGSFAKAAERLRLSPPAVTRAVAALETRLGARVFQRTTRRMAITEIGRRFLESARRALTDLDAAEKEAIGESTVPKGHLSITASVTFGRSTLAPVVCDFLRAYPQVSASVLLLDRVVNLIEEGIDVAIRIGPLPDSSLIAKRIGSVHRLLVASPRYLATRGEPRSPKDLQGHSVIAFTGLMPNREWRFVEANKTASIAIHPTLEINDGAAAIQAATAGFGIAPVLSYMVRTQLRDGTLAPVLREFSLPPQPVHLVYPHGRLVAPKVRAFVDFAAPRLAKDLDDLQPRKARPTRSKSSRALRR